MPKKRRWLGELHVKAALESLGMVFEREYKIPGGRRMYDFYIQRYSLVIEYDGEQHFRRSSKYHKRKGKFERCQKVDREKTMTAIKNGLKVLRIDYSWKKKSIAEVAMFISYALSVRHPLICTNAEMYNYIISSPEVSPLLPVYPSSGVSPIKVSVGISPENKDPIKVGVGISPSMISGGISIPKYILSRSFNVP